MCCRFYSTEPKPDAHRRELQTRGRADLAAPPPKMAHKHTFFALLPHRELLLHMHHVKRRPSFLLVILQTHTMTCCESGPWYLARPPAAQNGFPLPFPSRNSQPQQRPGRHTPGTRRRARRAAPGHPPVAHTNEQKLVAERTPRPATAVTGASLSPPWTPTLDTPPCVTHTYLLFGFSNCCDVDVLAGVNAPSGQHPRRRLLKVGAPDQQHLHATTRRNTTSVTSLPVHDETTTVQGDKAAASGRVASLWAAVCHQG